MALLNSEEGVKMEEKKRATEAAPTQHHKDTKIPPNAQGKGDIVSLLEAEQQEFKAEIEEADLTNGWNKVFSWEIDSRVDYPAPNHLAKCGKIGFFPTGNVHSISAKSKQGKTFLVTIFTSVILGHRFANIEPLKTDAKVLIFDTEQDVSDVSIVKKRVAVLNGESIKENSNRFKVIPIRGMEMDAILPFVERTIAGLKPTAVFLDNVADLAKNFNDNIEADVLLKKLMNIAGENECSIICVIHENPTGDTSKMKGHIGTLLKQKLASSFTIKKDGAIFKVTQTDSRHGEIEPFSFVLDSHLIPVSAQDIIEQKQADLRESIKEKFVRCFGGLSSLIQAELVLRVQKEFNVKSDKTARNKIDEGLYYEILSVQENGRSKYYSLIE